MKTRRLADPVSDDLLDELGLDLKPFRVHVCLGPNCTPKGSPKILQQIQELVWKSGLQEKVEVLGTSCRDRCEYGPSVNVYPGPVQYAFVDEEATNRIVREHLGFGQVVERYLFRGEPRR